MNRRHFLKSLAAIVLFALPAFAQTNGCYVSNISAPNCESTKPSCFSNSWANSNTHGAAIGALCDDVILYGNSSRISTDQLIECLGEKDRALEVLDECNFAYEDMYQYGVRAYAVYRQQARIIKQLKKKCGRACK